MARKRKTLMLLLLGTICLGTFFVLKENMHLTYPGREQLLVHISNLLNYGNQKFPFDVRGCRVPILDVNAPEIMSLLHEAPKVVCNTTKDWVEIDGSTAKITSWAKKRFGEVECSFTDIIRENDIWQHQGLTTTSHTEYNLENSDVVSVFCRTKTEITWQKVLMGIRSDQSILDRTGWAKVPNNSLKLNLLMLGFDSMSHVMWKRKLPKTYKYATNDLKGIALNGYNIVGDGTPQALIPILTGRTELELPDTRKRMGKRAQFVDVYPFIWNDFSKKGYVTAWAEDMPHIGTFTYRLKGFSKQPVDHYMRTFYIEAHPHFHREKPFCYGELSRYQIMINFVENMYEVNKDRPKFTFAFHGEYSHDSNDLVSNADDDTLKFLQDFNRKGYFNDTLLILMSDHGSRFASVRNTLQGKQEERLPGFIFVFPSWFSKKYPEAYENFKKNSNRLSTPFDIHETLKNVLHFEGAGMGSLENRGISLFKEIPLSRACQDAGIEPHWCSCLDWETIPVETPIVSAAADHLLKFVNSYTSKHRNLCSKLRKNKILWSAKLIPNNDVLRFKKNADMDGFVVEMTDNTVISVEIYQLKVSFDPGNMIFEASVRFYPKQEKFMVSVTADKAQLYDTVTFEGPPMMKQRLWPRHCVQDSWGAELHKDLKVVDGAIKIYKGTNPEVDSYSVFWDNKKLERTTLDDQLQAKNATDIYVCGLAYDVCVGATAVDALANGYRVILIDDCCRGVDIRDIEKTKNTVMMNNGVIVDSSKVKAMVEGRDRRPELGYKLAMELKG